MQGTRLTTLCLKPFIADGVRADTRHGRRETCGDGADRIGSWPSGTTADDRKPNSANGEWHKSALGFAETREREAQAGMEEEREV